MPRGPWQDEADLIVVGASVGGLAAAVIAADRGCRTLLLERTKELGGGAANEPECVAAAGSRFQPAAGIADDAARLVDDVLATTGGQMERGFVEAVAAQGAPIVAWLADRCGVKVSLLAGQVPAGHSAARLHAPGDRGGAGLVAELSRAVSRHARIAVRSGVAVEHLVRNESGGLRGVAVRGDRRGATQTISGPVLLACGGFAGDDALVAAHCPSVAELPYHGATKGAGEALRLGLEVGAATRRLGSCLVTPLLAMPGQVVVTAPLVALGGVLVNQAGRRFADETGDRVALTKAVRAQPGRVAYLLFDERIAAAARDADPFLARIVLPRTGRRGASLEDLAKQFELDLDALRQTADEIGKGRDPFGRSRPGGALEPPFHAIRVTGARSQTLGGLAVDETARVLDAEGRPIPGLYAAGGAAAGLGGEGADGLLAGLDTLTALGLARLAALDVASTRPAE
jgi:fumarate reductase flavoprotein subunit